VSAVAGVLLVALLGTPPATPVGEAPARALPGVVTVCVDRTARRCWTAAGGDDACAGGTVFGRTAANAAPGELLSQCWRDVRP
jgi:hypothetical protein